jgi:uncharacterized protein YdcH (DUF465 family)
MNDPHLDRALSEEFSGQADAIHRLKVDNAHFRKLLERNHALWLDIQHIQSGAEPAPDARLTEIERARLGVLDEIAAMLAAAKE